jgi:hypothetical protein
MAQLDEVSALLAGAGIRIVALKGGGHLARGVWPDVADRMMADLDLLVPAHAARDAQLLLLSAGYELTGQEPRAADHHHLAALWRPERFGSIEIHVEPLARGWTQALRGSEVLSMATAVPDRPSVFVPSPAHAAVIALVHSYLADGCWFEREVPLRTVHELWRLDAREGIDWSEARSLLRRVRRVALVPEYLESAATLLGAPRPGLSFRTERARMRAAIAETAWRRPIAVIDVGTKALDAGRLRRFYGTDIRGPWRLRAHHLRRALWRRAR